MVQKRTFFFTTLILVLLMSACAPAAAATPSAAENATAADLSGIKTYLLDKSSALTTSSKSLKQASDTYYTLAEAAGFDYAALWASNPTDLRGSWPAGG